MLQLHNIIMFFIKDDDEMTSFYLMTYVHTNNSISSHALLCLKPSHIDAIAISKHLLPAKIPS